MNNNDADIATQRDAEADNNLLPPYQTSGAGYPNIAELVQQINETAFDPDTGELSSPPEAIPHFNHYAFVGGLIPDENKEYIATCTKSAADDATATIWIDSEAVLAHEAKKLILQKCGNGKPIEEFTDAEKLAVVAMRDELHEALQNALDKKQDSGKSSLLNRWRSDKVSTREEAWINWIAKNGGGNRSTLKKLAQDRRKELQQLPQQMEALGNRPGQTQTGEVKDLFTPDDDMTAEEKRLLSALEKHYERQLCEGQFQRCSDLIRVLAIYRRGGIYSDVDMLPAIQDRLLDSVKAVGLTALDIQEHIFNHHADWIDPAKKPVPVKSDDEKHQRLERIFQDLGIHQRQDAFKPFGEIYIGKDFFSMSHVGHNNLRMSPFGGHAKSKALLIALTIQAYNLDYAELANKKYKEISSDRQEPKSIAETIEARRQLLPKSVNARLVDAIATYRYDGLVANALSSMLIVGAGVMRRSMRAVMRDPNIPMEALHPIFTQPLSGKFCTMAVLGLKSSWQIRETGTTATTNLAAASDIGTVAFSDYDTTQAKPRPVLPYKNGKLRWPVKTGPTTAAVSIEQFLTATYDNNGIQRPRLKKLVAHGEGNLNANAVFKNDQIAAFEVPDPKGKQDNLLLVVERHELENGRVMMSNDKQRIAFNELDSQITAGKNLPVILRIHNIIERKSRLGLGKGRK